MDTDVFAVYHSLLHVLSYPFFSRARQDAQPVKQSEQGHPTRTPFFLEVRARTHYMLDDRMLTSAAREDSLGEASLAIDFD